MDSTTWFRACVLALLLGVVCVLATTRTIELLAWTDAFVPPSHYPRLFAAYFGTWLAARCARGPVLRRAALLYGSLVTAILFDAVFATVSIAWVLGLHAVLFAGRRVHVRAGIAYVAVTTLALAVACNTDVCSVPLVMYRVGLLFALSYTFRVAWLLHETHLRREALPLADVCAYFLFAPFFVIVPHMIAIPRCDVFRAGLDRHDLVVEASGIRMIAYGTLLFGVVALITHTVDPRPLFFAAARSHHFGATFVFGFLSYPLFTVLFACAVASVLVGLVRVMGIDLGPSFDAPLLAANISEWWRRWNMHFRDLLVALFYYPVVMRLRRQPRRAVFAGAAAVFLIGSLLFHYPKYYFRHGTLSPQIAVTVENLVIFPLVAVVLWRERRKARRLLPRPVGIVVTWLIVFAAGEGGNLVDYLMRGESTFVTRAPLPDARDRPSH